MRLSGIILEAWLKFFLKTNSRKIDELIDLFTWWIPFFDPLFSLYFLKGFRPELEYLFLSPRCLDWNFFGLCYSLRLFLNFLHWKISEKLCIVNKFILLLIFWKLWDFFNNLRAWKTSFKSQDIQKLWKTTSFMINIEISLLN